MPPPTFETSTSPLVQSNDGRLELVPRRYYKNHDLSENAEGWFLSDNAAGKLILHTHERIVIDAYIAGYDLATATN